MASTSTTPNTTTDPQTTTPRRDYQTRDRQNLALAVLSSHELLMKHATMNHESIPQTRLRFEKLLAGIEETRTAMYVDVQAKDDRRTGTWAEREHLWKAKG